MRSPGLSNKSLFTGDYRHDPQWREGVVAMEHEPAGLPEVGTSKRKIMQIREWKAVTVAEVVEIIEGRRTGLHPVRIGIFESIGPWSWFAYSLTLKPKLPAKVKFLLRTGFKSRPEEALLKELILRPEFAIADNPEAAPFVKCKSFSRSNLHLLPRGYCKTNC